MGTSLVLVVQPGGTPLDKGQESGKRGVPPLAKGSGTDRGQWVGFWPRQKVDDVQIMGCHQRRGRIAHLWGGVFFGYSLNSHRTTIDVFPLNRGGNRRRGMKANDQGHLKYLGTIRLISLTPNLIFFLLCEP